jgi:hypothetical protein
MLTWHSCLLLFHSCVRPSTNRFSTTATLKPCRCSASAITIPNTPPHITTSKSGCTDDAPLLLLLDVLALAAAAAAEVAAAAVASRC